MKSPNRIAALLLAALALGAIGLAACSSDSSNDSVSATTPVDVSSKLAGMNRKAEVDPETAIVKLPVDYVEQGQPETSDYIMTAYSAALAKCAREELGIPWVAIEPDGYSPTAHMWTKYGPWTKPVAEKFAFVPPLGDGALIVNGFVDTPEGYELTPLPNEDLSEEQRRKVYDICGTKTEVQSFNEGDLWVYGPGQEALNDEAEAVNRDPRMQALVEELHVCYDENGIEFDADSPWAGFAAGAAAWDQPNRERITEEQIQLALKVVECKDQVDFTQRAADIIAERQVPIIEEHADELFEVRANWDNKLVEAKEYIASHPELFEPVSK
ncbi:MULTISPECIES: hypothetical protein [unclassified Actinobaculum]|uniref:hypothetical protein n=1 Tax=unclassified Actinobaculum TaxID=2609299 RepID=UPI000D5293D0|nr:MULTISPECIES: hypothetical protein [unclassified Actinobaculum]AWE43216.1 hypothetical protein DDD63_11205 [Actinobaculum sp. 313]RTE49885.1 hypothetical protein EKN07_05025 [Actinobaculum sp. 352]